jgi:hypothetical protein
MRNIVRTSEFSKTTTGLFSRPEVWKIDIPVTGQSGQHAEVLENFCDAIRREAELIAPAEEGIYSVELANTMLQSSLTGQIVQLPLHSAGYEKLLKGLIEKSSFVKESGNTVEQDMTKSF